MLILLLGIIFLAIGFNGENYSWGKNKIDNVTSGSSDPSRGFTKADLTQRLLKSSDKPYDLTLSTNTLADLNGMLLELTAPGTVTVNQSFDLFVCITTSTSSLFLPVLAIPDKMTLTGYQIIADSPTGPQYNFTYPPAGTPPVLPPLYPYMGGNIPAVIWASIPVTYQTGYHFVNLVDNMQDRRWLSADRQYIFEWRGDNITWHFYGLKTAECGDYKFGLFLNAYWEDSLTGEYRSGFVRIEEPLSVRLAVTIPIAPSNLIATAVSHNQIDLTWQDNSDNEDAFNIERRTLDTPYSTIATLVADSTTYSDIALNPSTTYFYRVNASNVAGDSSYSNEASATTLPPPVPIPIAPSDLVAAAVSHNQINLIWLDNSNNEQGFYIERKTNLDGIYEQIDIVGENITTYSDIGLSPGTTYYYRVKAYNQAGDSDYSNEAFAKTAPITIEDIINLVDQYYQDGLITNDGIYNSLLAKLNAAQASFESGNIEASLQIMLSFCSELRAQRGKQISHTAFEVLYRPAQEIVGLMADDKVLKKKVDKFHDEFMAWLKKLLQNLEEKKKKLEKEGKKLCPEQQKQYDILKGLHETSWGCTAIDWILDEVRNILISKKKLESYLADWALLFNLKASLVGEKDWKKKWDEIVEELMKEEKDKEKGKEEDKEKGKEEKYKKEKKALEDIVDLVIEAIKTLKPDTFEGKTPEETKKKEEEYRKEIKKLILDYICSFTPADAKKKAEELAN